MENGTEQTKRENYSKLATEYENDSNSYYNSDDKLPVSLREISNVSLMCVIAYCVVFLLATGGNVFVLRSLWKRHKIKGTRVSLLLLHLSVADLIVCCTLIPTEVFWRLTIQWRGGNELCKLMQFLQAFGLYLSSLVLICVSMDRFISIIWVMKSIPQTAYGRVKGMLGFAWVAAVMCSLPQAVFFRVESHPEYPQFKQCITSNILVNTNDVRIYSIFSVAMMYFVPLLVILVTYSAIIYKLVRKSQEASYNTGCFYVNPSQQLGNTLDQIRIEVPDAVFLPTSPRRHQHLSRNNKFQLRCNINGLANVSKAKTRTLLMTIVIVLAFVFCWTPYAVMTLWYMIDWQGAQKVNSAVQDAFFLMAVANSCINPLIYGGFTYDCGKRDKIRQGFH